MTRLLAASFLLLPGVISAQAWQRPQPGAIINPGHPLSGGSYSGDGIGYAMIFNEYSGVPMNLRETAPELRLPPDLVGNGGSWEGGGLRVNQGGLHYPRLHWAGWTPKSSFFVLYDCHETVGTDVPIVSKRDGSGGNWWQIAGRGVGTSNDLVLSWNSPLRSIEIPGGWPGTGLHSVAVSFDARQEIEFEIWVDGVSQGRFDNPDDAQPKAAQLLNLGAFHPGDSSHYMDATFLAHYFWVGRALTDADARQLQRDPYCFFTGRQTSLFLRGTEGPPTGVDAGPGVDSGRVDAAVIDVQTPVDVHTAVDAPATVDVQPPVDVQTPGDVQSLADRSGPTDQAGALDHTSASGPDHSGGADRSDSADRGGREVHLGEGCACRMGDGPSRASQPLGILLIAVWRRSRARSSRVRAT